MDGAETMKHAVCVIAFTIFIAAPAAACQCSNTFDIATAAQLSDLVAVGRVTRVARSPGLRIGKVRLENPLVVELDVEASWKVASPTLTVLGAFSDCDFSDFSAGETYLVFAEYDIAGLGRRDGYVWAHRCLPTQKWKRGNTVTLQSILGAPLPPPSNASARHVTHSKIRQNYWMWIVAIVVILAAAGVVYSLRRPSHQ